MAGSKSSSRKAPSTTTAPKVGTTRTGKFGSRVGGVAGRDVSGGRVGMTDAAVKAGSQAHGRSAPSTGFGSGTSYAGGGVVATTTYPGGESYFSGTGGTGPREPTTGGTGGESYSGGSGTVTAPVTKQVVSPAPRTGRMLTPTATTKPGVTAKPSVTAISIGRTSGALKTLLPTPTKPTALAVTRGITTATKAEPRTVTSVRPTAIAVTRGATIAAKAEPRTVAPTKPLIVPRGAR